MYSLLGRKTKLSVKNKLLLYKTILKPIFAYGIQLWGTAANLNIAELSVKNAAKYYKCPILYFQVSCLPS